MGNWLPSKKECTTVPTVKTLLSKQHAKRTELLLSGYLREISLDKLIGSDVFQLILQYFYMKSQSIVSLNGEVSIIDCDEEKDVIYKNNRYHRDPIYERRLAIINYDLIPYSTKQRLLALMQPLQKQNNKLRNVERFIHPHSQNSEDPVHNLQIRDLIDPYQNIYHRQLYSTVEYHWIPTVFEKSQSNHDVWFKISSEINDLPSAQHKELYPVIERIFNAFLPLFNDIVYDPQSVERRSRRNKDPVNDNICDEQRLFVVIKAQDYMFDGDYEYLPNWHKEGYDDESIEAVGIYYFDIENANHFKVNELQLRCITGLHQKPNDCLKYMRTFGNQNVETVDNMCIVFKNNPLNSTGFDGNENIVLHRAHLKVNGSASRRILCFFLVDPMKGNDLWTKEMIQNVNKNKQSKEDTAKYRESKNNPRNRGLFSMKPPEWLGDDPLTRIVYAGMGD
eukprot:41449_1